MKMNYLTSNTHDDIELLIPPTFTDIVNAVQSYILRSLPLQWKSSTHFFAHFSAPFAEIFDDGNNASLSPEQFGGEQFSLLNILEICETPQKTYWRNRLNTEERIGIGTAHVLAGDRSSLREILQRTHDATENAPSHVRYFGGARFYAPSTADSVWRGINDVQFVLPFLEFERIHGVLHLHCTLVLPLSPSIQTPALATIRATVAEKCEQLKNHSKATSHLIPFEQNKQPLRRKIPYTSRTDVPTQEGWNDSIHKALRLFHEGDIEKVVLARRTSLECENTPNAHHILRERLQKSQHVTAFYLQFDKQTVFLGTTPELLYQRKGRTITTEAIAGTRKRGASAAEDAEITQELMHSDKDRREHLSVQRYIANALDELTQTFTIGTLDVLKLSNLMHLHAVFTGNLRTNVDDATIVEQLHPTPAVGGTPRREALNFLQNTEAFDRGWYAAPVGWVNAHAAEFAVAIRSALVSEHFVHIFSGAGIVAGSEVQKEWQEIELKIAPLLDLFEQRS